MNTAYLTFRGFVRYGFLDAARDLVIKTIRLFGRDFERFGALHEYYQPENGEPILNRGFQNWNYLVLNMIAWLETNRLSRNFERGRRRINNIKCLQITIIVGDAQSHLR